MKSKEESYIEEVLRNIRMSDGKKQRIEADLRAHFTEAQAEGKGPEDVIKRLGAPAEMAAELMSETPLTLAGYWRRGAAFLLDMAVLSVVCGLYFAVVAAVGATYIFYSAEAHFHNAIAAVVTILGGIAFGGVFLLYFPIAEGRFGRTLGKAAFGLYTVKENGLPVGYKEAFLRRLTLYFNIIWLDALFALFTAKRQRAFDIIAKTIVIREQ
mgnify:CR=1 FL=1